MVTEAGTFPKLREDPREFRTETEHIFDGVIPTCENVNQLSTPGSSLVPQQMHVPSLSHHTL